MSDPERQRIPWHARLILLRPRQVLRNLAAVARAGRVPAVPNLWQIELGVLRMWHRILFRPETIGLSVHFPVRPGWRARLFQYRPLRFPFLLWEGSVIPWDLSGLMSAPERLATHVLGTHHEGEQFVYDLAILAMYPGALERLRDDAQAVVARDDRRSRWLRDLCVYEQYHETVVETVERAIDGTLVTAGDPDDPDLTFEAWLGWCARQPSGPRATWRAWRRGEFQFGPEPGAEPA